MLYFINQLRELVGGGTFATRTICPALPYIGVRHNKSYNGKKSWESNDQATYGVVCSPGGATYGVVCSPQGGYLWCGVFPGGATYGVVCSPGGATYGVVCVCSPGGLLTVWCVPQGGLTVWCVPGGGYLQGGVFPGGLLTVWCVHFKHRVNISL